MNKNFKKILSYALGIILAMGIGLTYAYAVGANDSNAFVTKTEWDIKAAQIESQIDNIVKTVSDNNMDFVMNGARLQVSLIDGFENIGGGRDSSGYLNSYGHSATYDHNDSIYTRFNDIYLFDQWDGRQSITNQPWATSNTSYWQYGLMCKFALKTTTPDWYVIVSKFTNNSGVVTFHYAKVGEYPVETSTTAKIFTIELPASEWWPAGGGVTPVTDITRTSSYMYVGNVGFQAYQQNANGALDGYSTSGGAITRTVTADKITYVIEFPASYYSIRAISGGYFNIIPVNMAGKKFATHYDSILQIPSNTAYKGYKVSKVYSPQKGCLSLKTYMNGEIPILNE